MIYIKSVSQIQKIINACNIWKQCADVAQSLITINSSGIDISDAVEQKAKELNASLAFYQYRGFPGKLCVSVNHVAIHGIPNNYRFKKTDKVSVDIGIGYDGVVVDAGFSCLVDKESNPIGQEIITHTYNALWAGISQAVAGNRIGAITHAIESYVKDNCPHLSILYDYCGHGCGIYIHEDPTVPNYGLDTNQGPLLTEGMVICIEPILTDQPDGIYMINKTDKWSVEVYPKYHTAHWEHMVLIQKDHSVVLTARGHEESRKIIKKTIS